MFDKTRYSNGSNTTRMVLGYTFLYCFWVDDIDDYEDSEEGYVRLFGIIDETETTDIQNWNIEGKMY